MIKVKVVVSVDDYSQSYEWDREDNTYTFEEQMGDQATGGFVGAEAVPVNILEFFNSVDN